MEYEQKTLTCVQCGEHFPFSVSGQKFFEQMRFTPPKRCVRCRRSRAEGKTEFAEVKCTECGNNFAPRFTPRPGLPVFCRDCVQKQRRASCAA